MAADLTTAGKNALLDDFLGNSYYVGLSTNGSTELSGNGYARKLATFDAAASGSANNQLITFDEASASWGSVSHFALFTTSSAGTQIGTWKALTAPVTVGAGRQARFAAGALVISVP